MGPPLHGEQGVSCPHDKLSPHGLLASRPFQLCLTTSQVHGSQGSLRLDNQMSLGVSSQGPALSLDTQTQAECYQEAYRQLFRHFLRTLQGW